jgi:metallophosphoesterase (TIGR00282 family)
MRVLFIADIVGEDAIDLVLDLLPQIKNQYQIDFTIANVENADKGKGVTQKQIVRFKENKIDCLTSGNHIWNPRKKEILIENAGYLLRPLNFPDGNMGIGSAVFTISGGHKIGVLNLQGRSFMNSIDCPFRRGEKELRKLRSETHNIIIDFHAEATAEKQALAWHFDGQVSAVIGTHTHVQTADERILPKGTAYISDAGMCGPMDSVIGMDIQKAIDRFILQTPIYYAMAKNNIWFNGVVFDIDERNGRAKEIFRLNFNKARFKNEGRTY